MTKQYPLEIFMPPNILKAKAGDAEPDADIAAILRAESALESLKSEFHSWTTTDVQRLTECRDRFAARPDQAARQALFRVAHDLKGQAATFEYPMISRMASSLTRLLEGMNEVDAVPLGLIDAHVTAIGALHRDDIRTASDRMSIVVAEELEARVTDALAETG